MKTNQYVENMATAATLFEAGRSLMRENIRRRHANASRQTVECLLNAWMRREDEPIPGDTAGAVQLRSRHSGEPPEEKLKTES